MAFVTALAMVFALAVPFVAPALAGHETTHDLDCEPEQDQNQVGDTHEITCVVTGTTTTETDEIDIEFISGPNDPDNGDSPTSPDDTIFCGEGTDEDADPNTCTVTYSYVGNGGSGTDVIRFWIDDDQRNDTFDADQTETRDEDAVGGGGTATDPDDTDVVEKTWFAGLPAGAVLDCDLEGAGTTDDAAEDDHARNRVGENETATCVVFNDRNDDRDRDPNEEFLAGVTIDAENENGANDPDNAVASPPDYTCTTDEQGECTVVISGAENQAGAAIVCFWIDGDTDNEVNFAGTDPNDGGDCDVENVDDPEKDDGTDEVEKTWLTAAQAERTLDAEPEIDRNQVGTQHSVVATILNEFGDPVQGEPVDFRVTGRNAQLACDDVVTNQQGVALCTYQDQGPTTSGGTDTICVFAEGTTDDDAPDNNVEGCAEPREAEDDDLVDVVRKFWVTEEPTVSDVEIDMVVTITGGVDDCLVENNDTATNQVDEDAHLFCVRVLDASGQPLPAENVTVTTDLGNFTNADGTQDRGQTTSALTDEEGEAFFFIEGTETGTATITATADAQTDTGTKVFETRAALARNIDCEPDTAQNDPGTTHVVTCTVTDRFGNPVPNAPVNWTESGPGRFTSTQATTDANGQAEAVVATTSNESGTQEITATLPTGDPGVDEECERPADEPEQGDPAGNCAETVTKTWAFATEPPPTTTPPDERGPEEFRTLCDPETNPATVQRFNIRGGDGQMIIGTNGDDLLDGTNGDDLICGLDGHDSIKGFGGSDFILGQRGQDDVGGGSGDDDIRTGTGHDLLRGGAGNDQLRAGHHNDDVAGGRGRDELRGGRRHDTLNGGPGSDVMRASRGNDLLRDLGGRGNLFNAGRGNDACIGRAGRGNIYRGCDDLRQI